MKKFLSNNLFSIISTLLLIYILVNQNTQQKQIDEIKSHLDSMRPFIQHLGDKLGDIHEDVSYIKNEILVIE